MRVLVLVLAFFMATRFVTAQPPRSIHALRDSLGSLPFVFEGYITSSKLFLGDKQGRPIDQPHVEWHDSIGVVRGFDTTCYAFLRAGIFVLAQHKGRLWDDHPIMVLSKIGSFKRVWYQVVQGKDTVLKYEMLPGKKTLDEFQLLLSKKEFSRRRLFFCKRWERIEPYKYGEAETYSNMETFLQIPLDPQNSQFSIAPGGHDLLYPLPLDRLSQLEALLFDL